jgi:hypothetical protein
MTDQQLVEELGKLPLMFQPGTSWEYGHSIDVQPGFRVLNHETLEGRLRRTHHPYPGVKENCP